MPGEKPREIQLAVRVRSVSIGTTSSTQSFTTLPLQSPRTASFAHDTTLYSSIEPSSLGGVPFDRPMPMSEHHMAQPQVSDVGFGYVGKHESVEMPNTDDEPPLTAPAVPKSPLKSAMKTPGAAPRNLDAILSPTFREEHFLEKHEVHTEKEQAKDLRVKTRVRIAKFLLRGVNVSCSLVVLAMISTSFSIFNASKSLPPRNSLPPWAPHQKTWPQTMLLSIACISLVMGLLIFYGYLKGGHRQAEKAAVYTTAFAVAFFVFSIVMWAVGAAVLQTQKNNSNNKDMWGWACVDNTRKELFKNEVNYELICRLQNWSLVCAIIEIVVEIVTISVYGIVFYRFYSKRKLRKSMAARDRARSDLYLAQLRSQSAPNTPAPYSARDDGWRAPTDAYAQGPDVEQGHVQDIGVEQGQVQYISIDQKAQPAPFKLQPPPLKGTSSTPKMQQMGFSPVETVTQGRTPSPLPPQPLEDLQRSPLMAEMPKEVQQEHFDLIAPGEVVYDSVPIPGAYEAPTSPGVEPYEMRFCG